MIDALSALAKHFIHSIFQMINHFIEFKTTLSGSNVNRKKAPPKPSPILRPCSAQAERE